VSFFDIRDTCLTLYVAAFVKVAIDNTHIYTTKAHSNGGCQPKWNEKFDPIKVNRVATRTLQLVLYNESRTRYIGTASIPLGHYVNGAVIDNWYPVDPQGEIRIRMKITMEGVATPQVQQQAVPQQAPQAYPPQSPQQAFAPPQAVPQQAFAQQPAQAMPQQSFPQQVAGQQFRPGQPAMQQQASFRQQPQQAMPQQAFPQHVAGQQFRPGQPAMQQQASFRQQPQAAYPQQVFAQPGQAAYPQQAGYPQQVAMSPGQMGQQMFVQAMTSPTQCVGIVGAR
jgi:hypothetical protein